MEKKANARPVKGKGTLGKLVSLVIYALVGAVCGILIIHTEDVDMPVMKRILVFSGMLVAMYGAIFAQLTIHEAGHLVFGRLSGYSFGSFRVSSFLWRKEEGRLRCKRISLAGTGGQCLMVPPELKDGKIPVFLYNMGGAILNIISAVLFFGLSLLCARFPILSAILKILSVIGLAMALLNGLPMRVGPVDNDGRNALSLADDPKALRSFWIQMKVMEQQSEGVRLKDMPADWFRLPADEDMKNSMIAALGVLACNRLMDEQRFQEANDLMAHMLTMDSVVGLHRSMMLCDCIYVELISKNRPEVLRELCTQEVKKTMKAMKASPSVMRTEYALALLSEGNRAKAEKILAQFEKRTKTYPYPCEIQAERELMTIAASLR